MDPGASFEQAWEAKDISALIGLLCPDGTAIGDGGGLVDAELRPVDGGERIAHYLVGRHPGSWSGSPERTVNGQPGLLVQQHRVTVTVMAFDVDGDRITRIWAVRNPEKLRHWTTA